MKGNIRLRKSIIELYSEKAFPNELQASLILNISRYYIRESLANKRIVKNEDKKFAFSIYHFGMDIQGILKEYK